MCELRFNPVVRSAIAVRPLSAIAELRKAFDCRFVFLQIEPIDESANWIRSGGDWRLATQLTGGRRHPDGHQCGDNRNAISVRPHAILPEFRSATLVHCRPPRSMAVSQEACLTL